MNKKGKITLVFVLVALILPSIQAHSKNEIFLNETSPIETNETDSTDEILIEMISDLPSNRSDNIPSVFPGDSFTARFNITNNSDNILNMLEILTETNDYGAVLDPTPSTKSLLEVGESWITEEKTVLTVAKGGGGGGGESSALDLAIVLDTSGSMGEEIQVLTDELITVVDEIDSAVPNLQVGLLLFGGSSAYNPLLSSSLIHPLTSDVSEIVSVLAETSALGSMEPWGDALYCAKNQLEWRTEAVKLVILITDEPNNSGSLIKYPDDLNELYHQYNEGGFILCTILASGWRGTTRDELMAGAEITDGTFIEIGTEYPQTEDIPDIIGELIVLYSVELDLKITVQLSYEIELGVRIATEQQFVILLDDLPPEIDTSVYFSEDFLTEEKFVNIFSEVKDVTGVPFVEIYYKFDSIPFWTIDNTTSLFNDSYCLTLQYEEYNENLHYQIYTKDWLGNEIYTEVETISLSAANEYSTLLPNKKKDIVLSPNQNVVFSLLGDLTEDSYGMFVSESYGSYNIIAADLTDMIIFLDKSESNHDSFIIPAGHTVKISLMSTEYVGILIANVIPQTVDFNETFTIEIGVEDAYLYKIDNKFEATENRQFFADSQEVQTGIHVFNASNMDYLFKSYASVDLSEEEYFMLVVADYHTGEIEIGFINEADYDPYDHYYQTSSWHILVTLLGLAALLGIVKRKKR